MSRLALVFVGLLAAVCPRPAWSRPPPIAARTPPALRTCCAFGYDLNLRIGGRDAVVGLHNVVERGGLGRHGYAGRSVFDERNGIVYTCRAGFIDLGHLRGAADLAAHLHARLHHEASDTIEVVTADGTHELETRDATTAPDRTRLAVQAAFDLTVWHEIVTGIDTRGVSYFSEAFSALSPEDLFSDLVGAHLGVAAAESDQPYDEAMDALIDRFLLEAEARPIADTRRAFDQVRGRWWRPEVRVPDARLLEARNPSFGPTLRPWQVPDPAALGCTAAPTLTVRRPASTRHRLRLRPPPESRLPDRVYTAEDFEDLVRRAQSDLRDRPPPEPPMPFTGVRLFPAQVFGGVSSSAAGAGGIAVTGAHTEGLGGDLAVIRMRTGHAGEGRGWVTHITGIQADHLFGCREQGTDRALPPIAAWFGRCRPEGVFGFGGTLAQLQHDGATGRWAVRPVELHASFSLLDDAFDPRFRRRHLVLSTGLGVETVEAAGRGETSLRANLRLRGRLASEDLLWQSDLHIGFRQDLLESGDNATEVGLWLKRRIPLLDDAAAPRWGLATVGLELAATRWTKPGVALDDALLPFTPTDARTSLRAALTLGFSFERLRL